jgi:hypothetical protein
MFLRPHPSRGLGVPIGREFMLRFACWLQFAAAAAATEVAVAIVFFCF